MTTLAEVSLILARHVTDVLESVATAGTATSLTDDKLEQPNGYWEGGTVWILSGTHAGKVVVVKGFSNSKLTFMDLGSTVGTPRYAVSQPVLPYAELRKAINQALGDVRVTGVDETLIGDGKTLIFELPDDVRDVYAVEFVNDFGVTPGHHWSERNGQLIFSYYPPRNRDTIRVLYKASHPDLVDHDDEVDDEINLTWLKWQSAVNVLRWAMRAYQNNPTYQFGDYMNEALKKVEPMRPLRKPRVSIRTA